MRREIWGRSQREQAPNSTIRETSVVGRRRRRQQGERQQRKREQQTIKVERRGRESPQAAGSGKHWALKVGWGSFRVCEWGRACTRARLGECSAHRGEDADEPPLCELPHPSLPHRSLSHPHCSCSRTRSRTRSRNRTIRHGLSLFLSFVPFRPSRFLLRLGLPHLGDHIPHISQQRCIPSQHVMPRF